MPKYPTEQEFLLKIAEAAILFCEELCENAEGVPQDRLKALHDALDDWEEDAADDTGICNGPGGLRERGA